MMDGSEQTGGAAAAGQQRRHGGKGPSRQEIHRGGFAALHARMSERERQFTNLNAALPPATELLDQQAQRLIPADTPRRRGRVTQDATQKRNRLRGDFPGQPELLASFALSISSLRRKDPPKRAHNVFFRCWNRHSDLLIRELPVRWLISSATTFADHGRTVEQRLAGLGLSFVFDLIKLHDSERRLTRRPNSQPFPHPEGAALPSLAFDMQGYALPNGDLDRHMLTRLWRLSQADATFRPLGETMLSLLMTDPRSIFARVQSFKQDDKAQWSQNDPDPARHGAWSAPSKPIQSTS